MTQQGKMLTSKPDSASSVLRTHVVEGENHQLWQVVLTSTHVHMALTHPQHTNKSKKKKKIKKAQLCFHIALIHLLLCD